MILAQGLASFYVFLQDIQARMHAERSRFSIRRLLGRDPRTVSKSESYIKPPKGNPPLPKSLLRSHPTRRSGEVYLEPLKVYPKPPSGVISVDVRLRGDFAGMILTTTVTFHAYDGLLGQVSTALARHFGPGAIGIASPRGNVITEDYQIYQFLYPEHSYTFCNVIYDPKRRREHPPIVITAQPVLVEVAEDDVTLDGGDRLRYIDPGSNYHTTYMDSAWLHVTDSLTHERMKRLAIERGDYFVPSGDLPTYDCVPVAHSNVRAVDACFSCACCKSWLARLVAEHGGRELGLTVPDPQPPPESPFRQPRLQDFDGLTLEQRRRLVRSAGGRRRHPRHR